MIANAFGMLLMFRADQQIIIVEKRLKSGDLNAW